MRNSIFTIGFTKKSAEDFFETLIDNKVDLLIDIRLNNKSQLAAFAKGRDLEYFCKKIARITYKHELVYAPTKELLDGYKKKHIQWDEYVETYNKLMEDRNAISRFKVDYGSENLSICFLCSESTAEHCHRRLLAELISNECGGLSIIHL